MSHNDTGDTKARAAELVREASARLRKHAEDERTRELVRVSAEHARSSRPHGQLSQAQLRTLSDAVEEDLRQPRDNGNLEERLARVEAATHVLAETVIALTEAARVVATAVRDLKAETQGTDVRPASDDVASPPGKAS